MSSDDFTKKKLWGGRFTGTTDPIMHAFNESLSYDKRMWAQDIRGSQAYAKALIACGVLSESEAHTIIQGLSSVAEEWKNGSFRIADDDEDIHTANERRLKELIGPVAGKLHTGRSRNDQVATDMRMWLLDEIDAIVALLTDLLRVMVKRAESEVDYLMPGYTHLQRAQPIRWAHWLLSHASYFSNDLDRLRVMRPRVSVLPLGAGPLAGNPFAGLDRDALAKELHFDSVGPNSMHSVADRDFVVEMLMWASLFSVHVSKMAEDLIIYSSSEFGFVVLSDAYSTGSSIMPQKKNPDVPELTRGKTGRLIGNLTGLLSTLKAQPLAYNRDLQEDKEPIVDSVAQLNLLLPAMTGLVSTLTFHEDRMRELGPRGFTLATDLAEWMVRQGVPFREAHEASGACVRIAEERGVDLVELTDEELAGVDKRLKPSVREVLTIDGAVASRATKGGTAGVRVAEQRETVRQRAAAARTWAQKPLR